MVGGASGGESRACGEKLDPWMFGKKETLKMFCREMDQIMGMRL